MTVKCMKISDRELPGPVYNYAGKRVVDTSRELEYACNVGDDAPPAIVEFSYTWSHPIFERNKINGDYCFIDTIQTKPAELRGRGAGMAAFGMALQEMIEHGCKEIGGSPASDFWYKFNEWGDIGEGGEFKVR